MGLKLSALDPKLARRIQDQMAAEDATRTARQHNAPHVGESELSVPPPVKIQDAKTGRITFGKRIRQDAKPLMNGIESAWFTKLAAGNHDSKVVSNLRAQALRFKISNGSWYKPDVTCLLDGQQNCFECKGPKQMKSMVRSMLVLKVAAFQYPEIRWTLVWKDGGSWREQVVLP